MAINLSIDKELLNEALDIGGYNTKKGTVTIALKEFIANRRKQSLIDLMSTIDYDIGYNYKEGRSRNDDFY